MERGVAQEQKWPLAGTRWTKFYLRPEPQARGGEVEGALATETPRASRSVSYAASGMTKAGVATASWTSTVLAGSLPRLGVSFETAPLAQAVEVTGPVVLVLWAEHDGGHGRVRDDPEHRSRRQGGVRDRSTGTVRAGRQGMAARIAPNWTKALAAVPPLPPARDAPVAREGRGRPDGRRDLADLDGVRARAPHPHRYPAARRRRRGTLYALRRRLQLRHQHHHTGGSRASYRCCRWS